MKRRYFAIAAVLVLLPAAACFAGGGGELSSPAVAEDGYTEIRGDAFVLGFRVSGENLEVRAAAKSTGWVAVGFGATTGMKDANIVMGAVSAKGVEIADHFGVGVYAHQDDTRLGGGNHVSEASGREEEGWTHLSFTIPLNSGDEADVVLTPGESYTVILAAGPDGVDSFGRKHAVRTSLKITL